MSLRSRYLVVTCASLLGPLLAYLLVDTLLTRSWVVQDHVASLRMLAGVLHGSLADCERDCATRHQRILDRFAAAHPDVELVLLDDNSVAVAASTDAAVGRLWSEEGIARVLRGESTFEWSIMRHRGEPVLDVTVPWRREGAAAVGAIHLARSLSAVYAHVRVMQLRHAAFIVVVVVVVGGLLSLLTYRLVIRRLTRLDRELRRTAPPASQPPVARGDEIDRVSMTLRHLVADLARSAADLQTALDEKERLLREVEGHSNQLGREVARVREDLLATQRDLVRAEHLATMGQLAAGLAHELRNPLFIIRGSAEAVRRRHPAAAEEAADVIQEVDRVETIIARLIELARPIELATRRLSLGEVVREVVDRAARTAAGSPSAVEVKLQEEATAEVEADPHYLEQALGNLVANACEAIAGRGEVVVRVFADAGVPVVEVRDTGTGIRSEDLPHVFEPFFTRKAGGTGLGLSATKKVLELHGATIAVASAVGVGTCMTVRFPQRREEE